MKKLNIAASTSAMPCFESQREVVDVGDAANLLI